MPAPELACVVMSCGNEPGLERAVRSILAQDVAVETVVVNCGGGGAERRLRSLGLEPAVWECPQRLNPGALRNRGIEMTSAPFVSFLAADCIAEPGWARGRLRRHAEGAEAVASALTNATPGRPLAEASFLLLFHTRMHDAPEGARVLYGVSYARELFDRHGGFREDLRTGEDSEFNQRIAAPIAWAPEVRTAHHHPTRAGELLREQTGRAIRMVRTRRRWSPTPSREVAIRALGNVAPAARASRRLGLSGRTRLGVLASLPLAAGAYAGGAVAAGAGLGVADAARRRFATVAVPSAGTRRARRRVRLLAVVAVRDERRRLPAFLAELSPHVDGVVALDDGSSDGSADWLASRPEVLEVIRLSPQRPSWREMENHRLLVEAAVRHGAEWIVAVDADELLEPGFRARAERVIARGRRLGFRAYAVRVRELWGDRRHYRSDGVWGAKSSARLFEARADHVFDDRELHGYKASLDAMLPGLERFPLADLELHHLAMLTPQAREARRRRYERLDPQARWQPELGYAYMTDERGLELSSVDPERGWRQWLRSDGRALVAEARAAPRRLADRVRAPLARRRRAARAALRRRAGRLRDLVAATGVPSAAPGRRRAVRLLAVIAVRDEIDELPGCIASLAGEVDGVIALDDGSQDGSAEWLQRQELVRELIRVDRDRPEWREMDNHRRLVEAAVAHGAEWILAIDADERVEPGFRARAERVIARGERLGFDAFALRLRELWGSESRYRADGVWGGKVVARLFRVRAGQRFDERPLHARKTPLEDYERFGYVPIADLELHHRGMLTAERRAARRRRYERLDPDSRWQPDRGYAYLTDESGLILRPLRPDRGWGHWLRDDGPGLVRFGAGFLRARVRGR